MQNLEHRDALPPLVLAALGIVFGDIGTSPLYTLKECFSPLYGLAPSTGNVLGILSLIFWSISLVVSLKYVAYVLRADNRGEGGVMALMALAKRARPRWRYGLMIIGIAGASLFYGDAVITPAISVLSAVEGLAVVAPQFETYVLPLALTVLVALFLLQRFGTARVGALFGPVMVLWFGTLAGLGVWQILQNPEVLKALNPVHAVVFFVEHRTAAFLALGAVVLALTGGEALYADMGHFGRRPIRWAWFGLVLPALTLNYFGQGALLLANPAAVENPFFNLAPSWGTLPLVVLATAATVIASQAVISGAYSLTRQAVQLGYCPRVDIRHTSEREIGQIYIPVVNWALLAAVVLVILVFGTSSSLAAAYGIAVTGTMVLTTMLAFVVSRYRWHWPLWASLLVTGFFLTLDLSFFSANILKVLDGGWLPLLMGLLIFTLLTTWKRGREILYERLFADELPLDDFIGNLEAYPPTRVEGTAVFMTGSTEGIPHALLHNLKHNKVLHQRVVLMTVKNLDEPYVNDDTRVHIRQLSPSFWQVVARYGFKESPSIPQVLALCAEQELEFEEMDTSFFLSRETLVSTRRPGMARWREKLFAIMSRNATRVTDYFHIPANRVVEMGTMVEI
ncbi:MAG: low affinity potassium transporter Kup [Laribacter sp.]|nr:low affinity potassium transporter Kup [Laribacter sp.]MBP9608845.1 low affinity potassium transporter Kup [Laribacter sp.]